MDVMKMKMSMTLLVKWECQALIRLLETVYAVSKHTCIMLPKISEQLTKTTLIVCWTSHFRPYIFLGKSEGGRRNDRLCLSV